MTTRNPSSSSTLLLIVILIVTFPIWVGICAAVFGLMIGLLGGAFGIAAGVFGALLAVITLPFKILFGWGHGWFPHFHGSGLWLAIMIILIAVWIKKRN